MQEELWYKEEPKTRFAPRDRQPSSDSLFIHTHKKKTLRNFKVTGLKENFKTARVPTKQPLFCPELCREQLGSSHT